MPFPRLAVRPEGPLGRRLDRRVEWLMRHLLGTPNEAIQKTHRWNNHHLPEWKLLPLRKQLMVTHEGDPEAKRFAKIPLWIGSRSHMTRYGGWRRYVVVEPYDHSGEWYVGWRWEGGGGVSRIPVKGPVRVLVGPGPVSWFGINCADLVQLPMQMVGEGQIGCGGSYASLPLF